MVVQKALELLEIDERGFDHVDRLIMLTIIDKFGGGPVGLDTLPQLFARKARRSKMCTNLS